MSLEVHLIGVGGTGMGALAGLLKELGHHVRGSDEHLYPPMSEKLREWDIPASEGFDARNLEPCPDLVIVGNVTRATNPEAVAARTLGLRTLSMPEAIAQFGIGDRHSVVVAGTHGKTTVSALITHLLMHAGRDPSFLVGGALQNYPESFRAGGGAHFVVEGDEYDTAYFDKGPKFMHYRPRTAVVTSLEYDHADIFPSIEAVEAAFAGLVGLVPAQGHIVVWHGAERARRLIGAHARTARVTVYAGEPRPDAHLFAAQSRSGPAGLTIELVERGEALGTVEVPLWGALNVENVLAAVAVAREAGLGRDELAAALKTYRGVRRRLEVRGEPKGVTVVDDFAHHPTAVTRTLEAARQRWPGRKLWALFEPRSATSRRNVFQREYVAALAGADQVIIGSHERLDEIPRAARFDAALLARELGARQVPAWAESDVDAIVARLGREARPGDVVLVFSNGSFGGLHGKLLARLAGGP